ncbi:MAG TPA: glutamine-hydrolyzing GMP synthase [bacterium]|uniref:GMP synthase [glutamine-hydrolyzing] n=1 Tax=candidate division TA06 bacterium ADurb.Bin417 TaxID=1852828 RepID=A0A1V5MJA2_UNCT6|nr:MAG: GMP synthase (glutamine-hydrolyzing) [candidate division TA06 bacterium ADurb.Bin417]HNQ35421.1 glutamine-hydrolyzing GMP synthase [bacterium]HNS48636.1 glutamine-hydrolyzing GMP synthase [bacterium]
MVIILDFGSQYTQLIARRVREARVYCDILPYNTPLADLRKRKPEAVIISGSPASVSEVGHPTAADGIFNLEIPILGLCYGMHLMTDTLGGEVKSAGKREYGRTMFQVLKRDDLFHGLPARFIAWMSHGDYSARIPAGFEVIGATRSCPAAAFRHRTRPLYGLQFHPEVSHTPKGAEIFHNFLFRIAGCKPNWTMASFIREETTRIRERVGKDQVVSALSGGVDSSVLSVFLHRALGNRLHCIFVDTGLLRAGERESVETTFRKHFHINLTVIDARERFLKKLAGVADPERKRKIIGEEFIRIFEEEARRLGGIKYLAQGTLYPDLIESQSVFGGPTSRIKSHHNVGGLPEKMDLKLIEPFKYLFKDEVRELGAELGLPAEITGRHPFPGPGLAVRILGEITRERLEILRQADRIYIAEIKEAGWYDRIWQALAVLLPIKTVGVMGDARTYENVIALRAVCSKDGMTADFTPIPHPLLGKIANRIINEVKGVNRVVYDVSSKPPATIEWE